jgi:hypothetical protein
MLPIVLFFLTLVIGIAVLYWIVLRNSAEKIEKQFSLMAEAYNLEHNQPDPVMAGFIRPEPSLYGKLNDRELSLSVPGKGLQNTRQIETVLKLELSDKKFAAQLTGTGLLGGFRQRDSRGMARWKSGDASFDASVDVRTNDTDHLTAVFSKEKLQSIAALLKQAKGSIYIGGGVIAYAELGLIANDTVRTRFESVLELFQSLAEAIEAA